MNVSFTCLYGVFFVGFIYVYHQLYEAIKQLLPQVAKKVQRQFMWMLGLSETIVFSRMIFISVADIAQV